MKVNERFYKYVVINTESDENTGTHPSFDGEFSLAKVIADELKEIGLIQIEITDKCYVYGCLPATKGYEHAVSIGFIAHMDTSSSCSGENVKIVLHENYDGKDIDYPAINKKMLVSDFSFLEKFKGETLITSDGTTLLGSDDKAGIAEIISALEMIAGENIPHGPIYVAFTPDEEIGEGADFFDLSKFKAQYAYTVDGGDIDCIEYENFNAASAKVTINGLSVHPGDAKNRMVNASLVGMEFNSLLPEEKPENTEGYEGFYHLTDFEGNVERATLNYIIRDHDRSNFERRKEIVKECSDAINRKYGASTSSVVIEDSYFNMKEKILPCMQIIDIAKEAIDSAGIKACEKPIRGGTDGARLSFMGLPCPNLGTGGYNFHGPFELNSVERMEKMTYIIKTIVEKYRDL